MLTFLKRGKIWDAQSATSLHYAMLTFLIRGKIWAAQSATSLLYAMLAFCVRGAKYAISLPCAMLTFVAYSLGWHCAYVAA